MRRGRGAEKLTQAGTSSVGRTDIRHDTSAIIK
jgi:hypothetical protein